MKREYFFVWAAVALAGAALALTVPMVFLATMATSAGGAVLYWFGRCHHGDRLGLLPPTAGADGARLPARWYCDRCGRSWPAGLDHDRSPVVRFSGYDQSKLPAAARRAAALEKQRQALAIRRAGIVTPRIEAPVAVANVTSITKRRVAG
jgi:hypothetical protein